METIIIETLLEMLNDRKYTFPDEYIPDKILAMKDKANYADVLNTIPFINNKVLDTRLLPKDDKGLPVYVYLQEGNEVDNPFGDTQPERLAILKGIIANLKGVFPEISSAKKLVELYEQNIHLILLFNGVKYDLIKLEQEAFQVFNFEAFPKKRLRFNVTKHYLIGKNTKLTKEQAQEYKERYMATVQTMSIYRIDDPVVRYYHGQPGDIFHCLHLKGGENYRMVVRRTIGAMDEKNK